MSGARPTPISAPLDGGLLIEASAGTGKTYTLTTLAARLVVEARRGIEDLLIVTFTVAATGELRTRIWQALHAARDAVRARAAAGGGQAGELAAHWRGAGIDHAGALLTRAIRDFDRANITTIHGFCQRALAEFALHAGLPFAFQVSGDAALEVESATRDFWRRHMVREPVALLEYAKQQKFVLDEAAAWAGRHHAKPGVFRPEEDSVGSVAGDQELHEAWVRAFGATRDAWVDPAQRRTFDDVMERYRWKKGRQDEAVCRAVIEALDANDAERLSLNDAGFFARCALADKLYKTNPPPDIPLFDCFERLGGAAAALGESWLSDRRRGLLEGARKTLDHASRDTRQLSFDALLTQLHRALDAPGGAALAARMRARYPVALIDEFQDTDRLQARIFEKIYAGARARGGLIVVGDPKQSIYRFRGADVFAYLDAKTQVPAGHTLDLTVNYRSDPALVRAVNAAFARENPFLLPDIRFEAARAAPHGVGALYVQDEAHDPKPFQLHLFPEADDGKKWNKGALTVAAAEHAAGRIVRLLELGATGRTAVRAASDSETRRALAAGDIAVLVRTGRQGQEVAHALRRRGVRTVELGTDSVFDSAEATALHQLLHALAADESDYHATARLRGALAGDLFGLHLDAVDRLREDDQAWAAWSEHAHTWRQIWARTGIAGLMRHLLFADHPACAANLLRYPDGPRRLTNFLHLTDLLHDAETRERLSRRGLMDWFAHFKAKPERGGETAQLRLESDENLVKIVTVHRAKGLEFPVAFCPFAWFGQRPGTETTAEYYDPDAATPVLDVRPSTAALDRQRDEQHSDELRLLYVALTRAQYRCEVTWARVRDGEHSPLAWLLHGESSRAASARHVQRLSAADWMAEVHEFGARAANAISVTVHAGGGTVGTSVTSVTSGTGARGARAGEEIPPAKAESLTARKLERPLSRIRQLTSYSALTAGSEVGDQESPGDHDAPYIGAEPAPDDVRNEFTFPAGSRPGNCLHEILANGLQPNGDLDTACRDSLAKFGIGAEWIDVARTMVTNTLTAPLPGSGGSAANAATFRLGEVDRPVAEMQFHLPVSGLRRPCLARALEAHGYAPRLGDGSGEIDGFLNGFIDLVARVGDRWYVIDYKSNWLGSELADYSSESISRAMARHGYHLQYLLYLTALHRLLRVRLPDYDYDRHVGGAFYLFLRGMRPDAPGSGVYRDRPSRACIEAIDACFQGEAP